MGVTESQITVISSVWSTACSTDETSKLHPDGPLWTEFTGSLHKGLVAGGSFSSLDVVMLYGVFC